MKFTSMVIFSLLLSTLNAYAQRNLLLGSWNYFDNNNIYNEITISEHYIYTYADSGDVERQKIKLTKNSLSFGQENWALRKSEKGTIEVQSNKNGKIKLFQMLDFDNELVDFYDWSHAKHHNGNGTIMYWQDATERKDLLLTNIKNSLRN